jgi:hypothetical protein
MALLFLLANLFDLILTIRHMGVGMRDDNPAAEWVHQHWGVFGLICLKVASLTVVMTAITIIYRRRRHHHVAESMMAIFMMAYLVVLFIWGLYAARLMETIATYR